MKRWSWILSFLIIGLTMLSIINNREDDPNFLDDELSELERYFEKRARKNLAVSEADVAWHLDHMLKTINNISRTLAASNPEEYHSQFNFQRIIVYASGRIPRGVAQSPPNVQPPDVILLDSLHIQLEMARQNLTKISELDEKAFFSHLVFDVLDRDQARRFLEIHTNHHLNIIADILGK